MACAATRQRKPFLFLDSFATNSDDVVMNENSLPRYVVLEKRVGETPLSCTEAYRAKHPELIGVPITYAGRLDPMASGKLLILLGEECKRQVEYHNLDKEYEFSVLFGIESDTQDVLGRLKTCSPAERAAAVPREVVRLGLAAWSATEGGTAAALSALSQSLLGPIELPYPIFSAKTVRGKPLHTWTLEGRLDEIDIPTRKSFIYELELSRVEELSREELVNNALTKINSIPPVTDIRKSLGNDFRRVDVRADWEKVRSDISLPESFEIAHFRCLASSGTYMRTLANIIAKKLGTCGLAWSIHRTKIGNYNPLTTTWEVEY